MGLIFNRGEDGCGKHHFGDYETKYVTTSPSSNLHNPYVKVKIIKKRTCLHDGCNKKEKKLSFREIKMTDEQELMNEIEKRVQKLIDEKEQEYEERVGNA